MKTNLILAFLLFALSITAQEIPSVYSWERQQAKVLPNGGLEWAPQPFELVKGPSVRYIDYDSGDDTADGMSTATPWKHHPWDASATGNAKASTGIHTYIFKRGVIYRGMLTAKESGVADNPVRLTSDPEWGTGEAAIYGSVKVTGGWTKADATVASTIPNPELVWYKNVGALANATKLVCEVQESGVSRVVLARAPNYVDTPSEPMQKWWFFTAKTKGSTSLTLTDSKNFTWTDVNALKGGDVWAIEDVVVMATLWKQKINDYNPTTKTITVTDPNFGGKDCKYYVENTPYLLDAPGEYYFDKATNRLFIRLQADKDPNTTTVEIASRSNLISISAKNYIEISGLTFGFTTYDNVRYGQNDGMPAIKLDNSSNIVIKNCKFQYLNGGIMANGTARNVVITDNEMNFMDDFSLLLNGPDEVSILRNKIFENGTRPLGRWYSSIPAIAGSLTVGEIAGNIVEHTWGSGINFTWGKDGSSAANVPFIRGLVHHNRVSHSLQGVNDYGGIESWQGGPVFTYNNISEDAQGWHYNWWVGNIMSLGYPFYFDGSFKQYVFNNIVKGTGWNRNSAAYNQVLGYYNMYVHNDAYNVASFTGSGDGNLSVDGQNYYLANVSDSTQKQFDHTTKLSGIPYESYASNFFSGTPFKGDFLTSGTSTRYEFSFAEFVDKLNSLNPDLGQVGYETSKRVFAKPSAGDFRPTASSELIDKGVKFFAPFPLKAVVGEWHFYKHSADSSLIKGENFYFTSEFTNRETYNNFPKNHMKAYGLKAESFAKGNLEDFDNGALVFDGASTYCSINHSVTAKTICNNVDMTTNNFILETYFKTAQGHNGGVLISKAGASGYGYQMEVLPAGDIQFSILNNGNKVFSQQASMAGNEGKWVHVLAEVNRTAALVNIYINGVLVNGSSTGTMPEGAVSFTNTADLLVGKSASGNYFEGTMDFMRISKGTLADAKTTIEELYKWEFDGPFLYDFAGNSPVGKRDAGALEKGAKLCNMTLSTNQLNFALKGGTQSFIIDAEKGFEVVKKTGTFFTYTVAGNTVNVTVQTLASGTRSGEIAILGCNETIKVKVIQQPATAIDMIRQSDIKVMPNPLSGNQLTIVIPEGLKVIKARLTDTNGQLAGERMINGGLNTLTVNLPNGMYFLSIMGPEVNYTTKIVIN
ncbi:MAG TPA: LamG-like jellyroll fold domain-containing protein [Prolixibacteraceae bacterium]|nr:LamG-like jellyroll fold domain-containing protein [Prolixibacteraceae bacterium]